MIFFDFDRQILLKNIAEMDKRYDLEGRMITKVIKDWNYHTDAMNGTFHEVRASFYYAVSLLDCGMKEYEQRAFDVIDKTISLQDTDPNSPSCGIWPYYEEEPLATKKSPIDYNWADFNAVSLLDIYMGHKDKLPAALLKKVENALVLAAKSVQKRNCGPGYTNIAIMGTYVTYVTSHLFDMPEMQEYANERLKKFYEYTQEKGGFSEYNSPTYSIVAIDELNRMQRHIVEPEAKRMIDELYVKCWEMIARHYHKKSAQWAGPHSRSYRTLVSTSYYGILKEASEGKVNLGYDPERVDVKTKHHIPENLLSYFLTPDYPRTETDIFEKEEPQIVGTAYLTDNYVLSSVSVTPFFPVSFQMIKTSFQQANSSLTPGCFCCKSHILPDRQTDIQIFTTTELKTQTKVFRFELPVPYPVDTDMFITAICSKVNDSQHLILLLPGKDRSRTEIIHIMKQADL